MSLLWIVIARLASGINGLLGASIMLAPLVTGDIAHHGSSEVWGTVALGAIVMIFGMLRLISPAELASLSWVNLALGGCVLVSPWLLRFAADDDRMWSAVAVGGTVMVLSALSAKVTVLMRQRVSRAIS